MTNFIKTKGVVLRRTNFAEYDRIVQFLTPNGQVSVLAKGVRKPKSKLAGGLELFSVSDLVMIKGKTDLYRLTSARLEKFYQNILSDYDRLQFGYEAINLTAKSSDVGDYSDWFDTILEVFRGLDQSGVSLKLIQIWFYAHYSSLTGHELSLDRDVNGVKLSSDKNYMYDVSEKGLRPSQQGAIGADHIKYMRLVANKPLLNVAQIGGVEDILSDCWLLARQHAAV